MSNQIASPDVQVQIDAAVAGLKAKNSELIGLLKASKESLAKFDGIDPDEIDSLKNSFQARLDESNGKAQSLEKALYDEKVGGAFARSKLVAEKLAIPADLVRSHFGHSFKVENGQMLAFDSDGEKIYSKARPGELADFDEALGRLIEAYPHKDSILKSSGASGGNAIGGGHATVASNSMPRARWEGMDPGERMAFIKRGGKVTD
jgi:hypothetical protein